MYQPLLALGRELKENAVCNRLEYDIRSKYPFLRIHILPLRGGDFPQMVVLQVFGIFLQVVSDANFLEGAA